MRQRAAPQRRRGVAEPGQCSEARRQRASCRTADWCTRTMKAASLPSAAFRAAVQSVLNRTRGAHGFAGASARNF